MQIPYSNHPENKEIKPAAHRKALAGKYFLFFFKVAFLLEKFQLAANCTFSPSGEEQVANSQETGSAACPELRRVSAASPARKAAEMEAADGARPGCKYLPEFSVLHSN